MIKICTLTDLSDPGAREFSIGEGEWPLRGFVVRYQGQVRAYVNYCPHLGLKLNFKPDVFFAPDVELLQCAVHGALFDPRSGHCVAGPCAGQRLHPLRIDIIDDDVFFRAPS